MQCSFYAFLLVSCAHTNNMPSLHALSLPTLTGWEFIHDRLYSCKSFPLSMTYACVVHLCDGAGQPQEFEVATGVPLSLLAPFPS